MSTLRPRRFVLQKESGGYGFHLHGEKGKSGQFVRLVEPDTPAAAAGLLAGDRLVFVNGERVEGEGHQQVVARIRNTAGALELIVVDPDTEELLTKHSLQCRKEYVTEGVPVPGGGSDADRKDAASNGSPRSPSRARENGEDFGRRSDEEERGGPRPRLCRLKKGPNGYGFNLHSDKSRPGQFIRAVDADSPAQSADLRPQEKILQVNGVSVMGKQHSDVVAAIKAGGAETTLLVVDLETDRFFQSCNVEPAEEHVTGPLPVPTSESVSEREEVSAVRKTNLIVNSSSSSAMSRPAHPEVQRAPEPIERDSLVLGVSVAQAKERARQKRAAKKAPSMAWSKRNELFGNL
ncbi:Na(+)/H(+) exchange regulatory cofactor NHE-RF1a [Brachionichthys hirsutus]|uniref:Na(+)/H(+) exchange regulatory cofactor NHE-RF1a n=1 Tax=Brachionichthys hirsutus TaxID=412623 RepID=UPI003605317E